MSTRYLVTRIGLIACVFLCIFGAYWFRDDSFKSWASAISAWIVITMYEIHSKICEDN